MWDVCEVCGCAVGVSGSEGRMGVVCVWCVRGCGWGDCVGGMCVGCWMCEVCGEMLDVCRWYVGCVSGVGVYMCMRACGMRVGWCVERVCGGVCDVCGVYGCV